MPCVLQALLLAALTRQRASREDFPKQSAFDDEVTGRDRAGRSAHIGAVEVEPDTPRKHLDIVLRERRISAGRAGLRAIVAFFDAMDKHNVRFAIEVRMLAAHFPYMHGIGSSHLRNLKRSGSACQNNAASG
jgi:hypothetical protein